MADQYQYWNSRLVGGRILEYVSDKRLSAQTYINYMLIRLQKMFKYEGLPETIPREMLECFLLQSGSCFITEVKGKLYAFQGTMGGEPDPYYRPTLYIVANPALKFNKSLDLWNDGVLMRNDSLWLGLFPLMARYASMMAENLVTIRSADVLLRVIAMLTAPDDSSLAAAEIYLRKLEKGEFGVIGENPFFEGVKLQSPPSNNGSYLTQFIELQQYFKASFYNEIGLNANYNMKREAIMESESSLNKDSLLPLCEEMLRCRKEDVERVNTMYGTSISVEFDSAWRQNIEEMSLMLNNASQLAGGDNGAETTTEGSVEDNGSGSSSTIRSDERESNGSDSISDGTGSSSERTDSTSTENDAAGNGEGDNAPDADENRDEEDSSGRADVEVNVEVIVNNNEGGDNDDGNPADSDNGTDGEGSESSDKDS